MDERGGGGSWVALAPDDPIRPAPESRKLKLAPGRHTIRVAFFLFDRRVDGKATDEFRVETNPVEFEAGK